MKLIKFNSFIIQENFLNVYFNTFWSKNELKTDQKLLEIHSKSLILTLFNKFLMCFEMFKK